MKRRTFLKGAIATAILPRPASAQGKSPARVLKFVPAGDLTLEGVTGDKDVELHAGNLVIAVGNAADYRRADASLMAGDLTAPAFDVEKGGLFRSFEKNNPGGKYLLHAHVAAGEITLRN